MNRRLPLSLLAFAVHAHATTCPTPIELPPYQHIGEFHEGLAVVLDADNQYGYIDRAGKVVIPVQFPIHVTTEVLDADFADGLAAYEENEQRGLIDKTGQKIIPAEYEWILPLGKGLFGAYRGDVAGLFDHSGKALLPMEYQQIGEVREGLMMVEKDELHGFANEKGDIVIPIQYEWVDNFADGRALFVENRGEENERYGYLDRDGKIAIAAQYAWAESFQDGLANVQIDHRHGFINPQGEVVIPAQYAMASDFKDGRAYVLPNFGEQWQMIDKTGKVLATLPGQYQWVAPDEQGFATALLVTDQEDTEHALINKAGEEIARGMITGISANAHIVVVGIDEEMRVLDHQGKTLHTLGKTTDPWLETLQVVFNRAMPEFRENRMLIGAGEHYGYLDSEGKMIVKPQYDTAFDYREGLAAVRKDDKAGYLDKDGNIAIPLQYEFANPFYDGLASVTMDGMPAVIDQQGCVVMQSKSAE